MAARLSAAALLFWAAGALGFDHTHHSWDALLKKHVEVVPGNHASRVRYDGFRSDGAVMRKYLDSLGAVTEGQFQGWGREQRLAFLLNAYNAFMIEKVLSRYPDIRSVWDFGKLFGNPFKDPFFALFGTKTSLDGIEHGVLRKPGAYDEPRIHFALNCASVGCPMLREEAYVAERLEAQLEDQAVRFLSDRERNRLRGGRLEVSKIFDWYRNDFDRPERFLATYADQLAGDAESRKLVVEGKAPLSFLPYDWSLNASRSSSPR